MNADKLTYDIFVSTAYTLTLNVSNLITSLTRHYEYKDTCFEDSEDDMYLAFFFINITT